MKRALFLFISVLIFSVAFLPFGGGISVSAQTDIPMEVPAYRPKLYEGRYKIKDHFNDSIWMYVFNVRTVMPPMTFKNKAQEEFYWRTVRDVKKTLPYAKMAFKALVETYEYIQTIPDPKDRERHLKTLEKDIVAQYKPAIMKMTKGQGKVLLKLIHRETRQKGYDIVKAFLGSFRAAFWNTFGSFFGMNLKAGYNPEKNEEDAIIERIAIMVEQGAL